MKKILQKGGTKNLIKIEAIKKQKKKTKNAKKRQKFEKKNTQNCV